MGLTAYAWFTKNDFTNLISPFLCWGLLLIVTLSMSMSLLCMLVFTFTQVYYPFVVGASVVIYGVFLLIYTQLVVGGGRYDRHKIDGYYIVVALFNLDIIMIFLLLL